MFLQNILQSLDSHHDSGFLSIVLKVKSIFEVSHLMALDLSK